LSSITLFSYLNVLHLQKWFNHTYLAYSSVHGLKGLSISLVNSHVPLYVFDPSLRDCIKLTIIHTHPPTHMDVKLPINMGNSLPVKKNMLRMNDFYVVLIVWYLDLQQFVQSVPITSKAVNSNSAHGEVYLIQHYVIKFVSYLRLVMRTKFDIYVFIITTGSIPLSLQSQEILNRPVFVVEILKKSEQILNIDWKFWTFWTLTENSEQILKILNMDWTESEHCLKSLNILNIVWKVWTESEQCLNILTKYIMWYLTY